MSDRGYPDVRPRTMRDAYLIATALEQHADSITDTSPAAARSARTRALRTIQEQHRAAELGEGDTDARGRWVSRAQKCGPALTAGPAHVTAVTTPAATTDAEHRTICGRRLAGRDVTFGPQATGLHDCPAVWSVCRDCRRALATVEARTPEATAFLAFRLGTLLDPVPA